MQACFRSCCTYYCVPPLYLLMAISTTRRISEALAVIVTAFGKFVFMDWLKAPIPFIILASVLWIGYIVFRQKSDTFILSYWGFRTDNFTPLAKKLALPSVIVLIACIALGYTRGTLIVSWHIVPLLIVYPFWGTIQQYLCMALVAGNLRDMEKPTFNKTLVIFFTATLFSAMHFPNLPLAAGTFILALVYGFIYLHEKNLFVLGILHGWLGAVFYYTVAGADQWEKIFGRIDLSG
jgi:hypothetical protein